MDKPGIFSSLFGGIRSCLPLSKFFFGAVFFSPNSVRSIMSESMRSVSSEIPIAKRVKSIKGLLFSFGVEVL